MLQTGIFSFGVFSDGDDIHIIVDGIDSWNSLARTHVGIELKVLTQCDVKRTVTLSNGGFERSF